MVKTHALMATFSVCIPSYNAAKIIGATIDSLIRQTFTDWECLVVDDGSTDGTEAVVRTFSDPRIRFIKNNVNLGCAGNFQRCRDLATGTYIYFLANDDILSPRALERTYAAFQMAPDIALVTRPYYWFEGDNPDVPIRYTKPLDASADQVISIEDSNEVLCALFETLGQVTALAYRNDVLLDPFSPHVWTTHIQPFLLTFKKYRAVFLHDYLVAIRTEHSQARNIPSIYDPSALWTWAHMMQTVFAGQRWSRQRRVGIDNIARRAEGLVQIRCHSTLKIFLREAWLYLWYRPLNVLSPRYWFFAFGCLVMPPIILRRLVDGFRSRYATSSRNAKIRLAS